MGRHSRELRGALQRRVDAAQASQQVWMVGLIAFTGVFREGAETVLFLWGLTAQLHDLTGWTALGGAAAGLFSAGVGRLQGLGLLPGGDPLWATAWLAAWAASSRG